MAGRGADVLSYMQTYWKDYQGDDQNLWSHEWSKHGTCVSTLDTKCYTDYQAQQEVVDYFNATVALFKTLPTYETLAAAGIIPSHSRTWMEEEIQAPLQKMHGMPVTLRCRGKVLNEVWYHFSVRGSVQSGDFVAAQPDGAKSSCPGTGIRYLPKDSSESSTIITEPTRSRPVTLIPSPTSSAAPSAGTLAILMKGEIRPQGCLISGGRWYMTGTCATFHFELDASKESSINGEDPAAQTFTVRSSKGPCGIVDDEFQCAKRLLTQTVFSATPNGTLMYQNHTSFYADAVPRKFEKGRISTVRSAGNAGVEVEIVWSPPSNFK